MSIFEIITWFVIAGNAIFSAKIWIVARSARRKSKFNTVDLQELEEQQRDFEMDVRILSSRQRDDSKRIEAIEKKLGISGPVPTFAEALREFIRQWREKKDASRAENPRA